MLYSYKNKKKNISGENLVLWGQWELLPWPSVEPGFYSFSFHSFFFLHYSARPFRYNTVLCIITLTVTMGVQQHLQDTVLLQHRSHGLSFKEITEEVSGVLPLAKTVSNFYLSWQILQHSKNIKKETAVLSGMLSYLPYTVNIAGGTEGACYILKLNY